jgi:hypothetical protein
MFRPAQEYTICDVTTMSVREIRRAVIRALHILTLLKTRARIRMPAPTKSSILAYSMITILSAGEVHRPLKHAADDLRYPCDSIIVIRILIFRPTQCCYIQCYLSSLFVSDVTPAD